MKRLVICYSVLFSSILFISSLHAFIAGGKAPGMGLTGIAYPQDAFAAVYNPAGAIDVGDRFDVGLDWMQDHKYMTITMNNTATNNDNNENALKPRIFFNTDFAINKALCSPLLGQRVHWSVGLAVYNRDFIRTRYHKPIALVGTTSPLFEYLHETVSINSAIRFFRCLSLGISMDIHMQRLNIKGFQNFDNAMFSAAPGFVTNNGYSKSGGVGVTFGWKWDILRCLSVGLTYRPRTKMSSFHKYKGFIANHGRIDIPEKIGGGLSWEFLPGAVVAADVEFLRWDRIRSFHNDLLNESGTMNLFGDSDGPAFGWDNQTYYRVGVDWAFNRCWTFRAGYSYSKSLVTQSETFLNSFLIDLIESTLSVGATWTHRKYGEVTFFYIHYLEHQVKGNLTSIPDTFGSGQASIRENRDAVGISWGYFF